MGVLTYELLLLIDNFSIYFLLSVSGYMLFLRVSPLHSTPLTGRAVKPQRQGHIGGPIAQP